MSYISQTTNTGDRILSIQVHASRVLLYMAEAAKSDNVSIISEGTYLHCVSRDCWPYRFVFLWPFSSTRVNWLHLWFKFNWLESAVLWIKYFRGIFFKYIFELWMFHYGQFKVRMELCAIALRNLLDNRSYFCTVLIKTRAGALRTGGTSGVQRAFF